MKMNRNEMEALYAFGCPNLKATVERLRMNDHLNKQNFEAGTVRTLVIDEF